MAFIKVPHHKHFSSEQKMFITPQHMSLVWGSSILNREIQLVMLNTSNK